jgi:predicted esterase
MNRVFATGHSSGAYFAVALLQADHAADAEHLNLRGMAPVAASPVNNHSTPMAVLYMENPNDSERGDDNAPTVVVRSDDAVTQPSQC